MKHVPDNCPTCGFVWGHYQGSKYGIGYLQLAANVLECTRCSEIVTQLHPLYRYVARR